jgi:hypothetical protein
MILDLGRYLTWTTTRNGGNTGTFVISDLTASELRRKYPALVKEIREEAGLAIVGEMTALTEMGMTQQLETVEERLKARVAELEAEDGEEKEISVSEMSDFLEDRGKFGDLHMAPKPRERKAEKVIRLPRPADSPEARASAQ